MAGLRLKPETLVSLGLPDIDYPIGADDLAVALAGDGELPFALMLAKLQVVSAEGVEIAGSIESAEGWRDLEPALARLAELVIADAPSPESTTAAGEEWWLEIGPVSLSGEVITVQRGDTLIAAIAKRTDGRLRVATFRPLDSRSAELIISLARVPAPDGTVCLRDNNWEYALDSSAGAGSYYADAAGQSYLSYWQYGVGVSPDGSAVGEWMAERDNPAIPVVRTLTELGVYYTYSEPIGS